MQNQTSQTQDVQTEMSMLLNCSLATYRNILYKYGRAYIHWYLPCDERLRRKLEDSKTFWAWFRVQWEMHDRALLDDPEFFDYTVEERRRYFKHLHEPQVMAVNIKPNDVVLAELNKKDVIYE